jgi:hypothetical protein
MSEQLTDLSNNVVGISFVPNDAVNNIVSNTDVGITLDNEGVNETINNEVNNLILTLIKENIKNKEFTSKINLNEESIRIINLIIENNTNIFDDLDKNIKDIIADRVLDINDIPSIILSITDIINLSSTKLNKLKITRDQVINFIKDLLKILIELDTIKVNDKVLVEKLIDLSIKLLSSKINVKKVITCFTF